MQNFRYILVVVALLGTSWGRAGVAATDDSVRIALRSATQTVYQPLVTIGDIAAVNATDQKTTADITKMDLEMFKKGIRNTTITATQIRCRLLLAGYSNDQIEISGANTCSVDYGDQLSVAQRLEIVVGNEFAKQFAINPQDVRAHLLNPATLPQYMSSFNSRDKNNLVIFEPKMPIGKSTVDLEWSSSDGSYHSAKIAFRFVIVREVLVARRMIARGELIGKKDVHRVTRPISNNTIQPISFDQCVGQIAAKDIAMHQLIQARSVGSKHSRTGPKLLKRNDFVNVIIKRGTVTIVLKGAQVLSEGSPGDTIQLKNLKTNKTLLAEVVDQSTAIVR